MITKEEIRLLMLSHNINSIIVNFSGGGDDGDINEIELINKENGFVDINDIMKKSDEYMIMLRDFFFDILHQEISKKGMDWINNDGGYGNLKYDLEADSFNMDYIACVPEEFSWGFDI